MITVKLDELGYFSGSFAKIGSIPNGVKVSGLPSDLSNHKTTCWKYGEYQEEVQVPVEVQQAVIDEETGEQKIDENGELVYETVTETQTQTITKTGWTFDEAKYAALLEEIANYVPPKTETEILQEELATANDYLAQLIIDQL